MTFRTNRIVSMNLRIFVFWVLVIGSVLPLIGCKEGQKSSEQGRSNQDINAGDENEDKVFNGKPLADWIDLLKQEDKEISLGRSQSVPALTQIGREAVPALIKMLKEESDGDIRWRAPYVLYNMGADARSAVPALRSALNDPDQSVQHWAAMALAQIPAQDEETVVALLEQLRKGNSGELPGALAQALASTATDHVPMLTTALHDSNGMAKAAILYALGEIDSIDDHVFPFLVEAIGDEHTDVRMAAVDALPTDGSNIKEVTELLVNVARSDTSALVRRRAIFALGAVGPKADAAIPAVATALNDADHGVQDAACQALNRMGDEAGAAVPALLRALKDEDDSIRRQAALALWKIDPEHAPDAVSTLVIMLEDGDSVSSSLAVDALGEMGADAKIALPSLRAAMEQAEGNKRRGIANALSRINSHPER